jgi:ADP-Ribosyltransferase in polyvalent proteins
MADRDEYVSVLERGNMASPDYRAYLERAQALEGSHPEIDLAGLGLGSLLKQGGNFIRGLLSGKSALTQAEKEANLAQFLTESKAPPTLYHGTTKDFPTFDQSKLSRTGWGEGFHLAEDPSLASMYAGRGAGANVMPVHAAIKNPLELKSLDEWFDKIPGKTNAEKTAWAKSQGYDGVKYPHSQPTANESGMAWVAFEPTQIKSAIGNRGTYNPKKKDLNKAKGGFIDKPIKGGNKHI